MKFKRGDTLIEVMFAVSVFGAMMVGGLAIMNGSYARTMASLQLTMARNAIDSQAEALRFVNGAAISHKGDTPNRNNDIWTRVVGRSRTGSASNLNQCPRTGTEIQGLNGFFLNTSGGGFEYSENLTMAQTFPQIVGNQAQGLWVEPIRGTGYFDFHIRACWVAPGNQAPTTLGTIVRLYAPN